MLIEWLLNRQNVLKKDGPFNNDIIFGHEKKTFVEIFKNL